MKRERRGYREETEKEGENGWRKGERDRMRKEEIKSGGLGRERFKSLYRERHW